MGKSSFVWNYFSKLGNLATCKLCRKKLKVTNGNTSTLSKQLASQHAVTAATVTQTLLFSSTQSSTPTPSGPTLIDISENEPPRTSTTPVPPTPTTEICTTPVPVPLISGGSFGNVCTVYYNASHNYFKALKPYPRNSRANKRCSNALFMLIIRDMRPLNIGDGDGFMEFCKVMDARFVPKSRTHYTIMMFNVTSQCKQVLSKQLKGQMLAFTMDIWSARTMSLLSVTCTYIDELFQLHQLVLGAYPLGYKTTWTFLQDELEKVRSQYGLTLEQITVVMRDQGGNIKKALKESEWESADCTVHKLQLCVIDGLKVQAVQDFLEKCKKLVKHFNKSTRAGKLLQMIQSEAGVAQPLVLIQSVITRWNSQLHMMERLWRLRDHLRTFKNRTENEPNLAIPKDRWLKKQEWKLLDNLVAFLMPFDQATKELCKDDARASMIIPMIKFLQRKTEEVHGMFDMGEYVGMSDLIEVQEEVEGGLEKRFQDLGNSKELVLATILDPRFKKRNFPVMWEHRADRWLKEEADKLKQTAPVSEVLAPPSTKRNISGFWSDFRDSTQAETPVIDAGVDESPIVNTFEQEWEIYSKEGLDVSEDGPLPYWQNKSVLFPILSQLARKYLNAPATSVASERLFSKATHILNKRRNRLTANHLDQLLFLNANHELCKKIVEKIVK